MINDMKNLARLMGELKGQIDACTRCGMCQSVCPVFAITGRESDVARGKIAMLDGLAQELFKNPTGVLERLDRCVLCGSCAVNCPGNVGILEIFISARAAIFEFVRLPWYKKIIFRWLLASPMTINHMAKWLQPFQKLFAKPASNIIGTSCARVLSPVLKQRHFVPLAPVPFHQTVHSANTKAGASGIKAAFFPGCIVDKWFPHIAAAAFNIFEHHGVGIFLPSGLGCCGIPALTSGDTKTFIQLIHLNLERLNTSTFDVLITPCATCTFTIKKIWPLLVQNEIQPIKDRVKNISPITMDISEFLVKHMDLKPGKKPVHPSIPITYHDPCHLKKSLNVFHEPRSLLRANTRYHLKEMENADDCCGMGGSFNLNHYDLSTRIGERKRKNIMDTNCKVVATGCPACMLQISDMLSKAGDSVQVKHVIEIYSESLK